jgi:hypothetical protein
LLSKYIRLLFAIIFLVGNARSCVVSFTDSGGIRHSVEVAAESLYEAAALAVAEFRRNAWVEDLEPGAATPLAISVKAPATTHEMSVRQLEKWTARTAKNPRDTLLKSRVRELLTARADFANSDLWRPLRGR